MLGASKLVTAILMASRVAAAKATEIGAAVRAQGILSSHFYEGRTRHVECTRLASHSDDFRLLVCLPSPTHHLEAVVPMCQPHPTSIRLVAHMATSCNSLLRHLC